MPDVRAICAAHHARHSGRNPGSMREEHTEEERELLLVMDRYKTANRRPFPSLTEVLAVMHAMGYRNIGMRSEPDRPAPPVTSQQLDRRGRSIPLATERRSGVSRRRAR